MIGQMKFQLGALKTTINGGRYYDKPFDQYGVNLAEEIYAPCLVHVPTRDFAVPDKQDFKVGLMRGIMAMTLGHTLYVGCMGGIGRTGTYLAGMAKVMAEYRALQNRPTFDPIMYVRREYLPYAIETDAQERFIRNLDVADILDWWYETEELMNGHVMPTEVETLNQSWGTETVSTALEDRTGRVEGCVLDLDQRLAYVEQTLAESKRNLPPAGPAPQRSWWKIWA